MSATSIQIPLKDKHLQWRHYEHDGVSNHWRLHCFLNRLSMRRSKKTSKFRVTGLCEGNSPVTGEFPAQRASNADNVSIWWRHHAINSYEIMIIDLYLGRANIALLLTVVRPVWDVLLLGDDPLSHICIVIHQSILMRWYCILNMTHIEIKRAWTE